MNISLFRPGARRRWPGRAAALLACLLLAALLLPAGWTAHAAQEAPPDRLPYDSPFDLLHQPGVATQSATGPTLTAPTIMDWSRLVFQSARNERDWEIYAARGDGSDQVNISNHGSMDIHPRLNRGATRVVFASNRHGTYDLFVMNADGGDPTRIVDSPGDDVFPAWSPDGGRVAFQAYRDGQPEIYAANADGSGQTRLTNHDDYDGQPVWSPDGRQIAFVRRESGGYRIWAMNTDGTNQRQLSNQAYSADPAWSPDGSQIAYDADGNGDGWQEIWLMNADGANQREIYDPSESNTDAWVGSWSPDGRYLAFTRISFINYQGQWYWTYAFLDAWDSAQPWNTVRLSYDGADWNPAWASTDGHAPESRALALPPQSPATFTVFWTGDDTGGSGLKDLDVQIREGAGGTWADWQTHTTATSASFTGVGGRAYYFRTRGRDHAGNVEAWPATHDAMTTVEPNPPLTAVEALPAYSRNGLLVRWGGSDPGGSGIQSYDVQVRQGGSGTWTDWRMDVTETSTIFDGIAGLEYRFRSRARDRAQNVEAWPATADAITTLYTWAIAGTVTDNRGAPVVGMATTTTPAAFRAPPSDGDGVYSAYVATEAASYSATWRKSGYGALPSTSFPPATDAAVDVVLPPADNVVQNWGFENGNSAWQLGGTLSATIAGSVKHSGASAAFLGSAAHPLGSGPVTVSPLRGWNDQADAGIDGASVMHAVWIGPDHLVMYSRKSPGGAWTAPAPLTGPPAHTSGSVALHVDGEGTLHVVWCAADDVYYRRKPLGADWSAAERIPGSGDSWYQPDLTTTADGTVKVAWSAAGSLRFAQRNPGGAWSAVRSFPTGSHFAGLIRVVADRWGRAHLMWVAFDGSPTGTADIFHAAQNPDGAWSPVVNVSNYDNHAMAGDLVVDSQGTAHAVWAADRLYYRMRPAGGTWATPVVIEAAEVSGVSLAVDDKDRIHLAWGWRDSSSSQIHYSVRSNGSWAPPSAVAPPVAWISEALPALMVDSHQRAQVVWAQYNVYDYQNDNSVRYSAQDELGHWSTPAIVFQNDLVHDVRRPRLYLDSGGVPHTIWESTVDNVWSTLYAGPQSAADNGEAYLAQAIQVPAAAEAPTLSFLHRFDTEFPSASRLEVVVDDAIAPTVVFSNTTGSNTWAHQWADLTPWAGRNVTLRFRVIEVAGGARAWAYIDEVTVGSAHPDTWISQPAWQAAPPGRTFETTVAYGNRGGVAASGGQVTLQLPAELSFVSASPPPSATTPLRWDVGALPAQSGPQTIRVTLQVAASAAGGSTVSATARITASATELEQANNTAQGAIYIGSVRYLPVIMR